VGFKRFYTKNRVKIFVVTSIVTSVVLAIAMDRVILRKKRIKKPKKKKND
jgi:hypothetical protein